ncbi:MAG TPA: tripartite tricarboxylate transporter substrate binding protein [Burkholderiales bacterium]|nr:tripartite tricarboxylate transporter substrate binding protein [Burkholderiales bacterium]
MSKIVPVLSCLTVCGALFCGQVQAAEQPYPTRPIRVIIPTTPGGGSDQIVRSLGQKFTAAWGQQVVVDHRPGAGMTIGIDIGAKASPDGHTLVMVNPSHAINATLYTKLPYDPVRDLTPITVLVTQSYGVVVPNSLPVKTVKDMIALAKAKPREINFASSGNGSASHLAGEMFVHMAGVEMTHIPYKGTGTVMPDLIAGRVSFYINPMLAVINQVQAKQIRLIAVTSLKRVNSLPDVPTVAESGVPGYEATSWYMMLTPGKTPAAIVNQLNKEIVKALTADDMREMMARAGVEPLGNTPREAMEFLKVEIAKWGKVIRMAKVKID